MKKFSFTANFKYFLIATLVIVVAGLAVLGFAGFNRSSDYVSAYEVKITADENFGKNNELIKSTASKVFKDNNVTPVSYKDIDSKCVVIYEFSSAIDADVITKLQAALDTAFASSTVVLTTEGSTTSVYSSISEVWWVLLAVGIILVLAFFYTVIRYKWAAAFSMLTAVLADILLVIALTAVTRVVVTPVYLSMVLVSVLLTVLFSMYMYSLVKENMKNTANAKMTDSEHAEVATKNAFLKNIITLGATLVIGLAMLIIGTTAIRFAGLQLILAGIAAVFTSVCLTGNIYAVYKNVGKK